MDPDREDAARLRRGDTAGLAGLMGRHQDRLFRYLLAGFTAKPPAHGSSCNTNEDCDEAPRSCGSGK